VRILRNEVEKGLRAVKVKRVKSAGNHAFWGKFNLDEVLSFKPGLCDRIFSLFHPEVTIHLNFIQFK